MNATKCALLALSLAALTLACDTVNKQSEADLAKNKTNGASAPAGSESTNTAMNESLPNPTISKAEFGKTKDGQTVDIFTLKNANGTEAKITNYGGYIVSIKTKDKAGKFADVTLGFDDLAGYQGPNPFFGCVAGRYANRIAKGSFKLGDKTYTLAKNNGPNALHGGVEGFNRKLWTAKEVNKPGAAGVEMSYLSKDGEEGYPGNLTVTMTYWLNNQDAITIDYSATTDKDTVINLTNHTYFNLSGEGSGDILKHEIMIAADKTTPVDSTMIPTGEFKAVTGTPFDFTKPMAIGARIDDTKDEQIAFGKGYDHNFVLNKPAGELGLAAKVTDPASGRVLEISTTEPGVQFYTANHLDGTLKGKGGKTYPKRTGFCLETQHFPDSPNHPNFPTTTLKPGETFKSSTVYKFSMM